MPLVARRTPASRRSRRSSTARLSPASWSCPRAPRPAPRHAVAAAGIVHFVGGPFCFDPGGPGGWWILDEPEIHLGIDPDFEVVVPDLSGWRREKMPILPDTAWFEAVPDWVCEVLSPGAAAIDRSEKLPFYARAGVSHAWLVDPILETIEAYRLDARSWRLLANRGAARDRIEPFDAIELDLSRLWVPKAK